MIPHKLQRTSLQKYLFALKQLVAWVLFLLATSGNSSQFVEMSVASVGAVCIFLIDELRVTAVCREP